MLTTFTLNSQNIAVNIDSLKKLVTHQTEDSVKVDNLLTLSYEHHQIDIALCKEYATQGLLLSQKLNLRRLEVKAYKMLGIAANIEGNPSLALEYATMALEKAKLVNDEEEIAGIYNILGILYDQKGDSEKSLEYLQHSLILQEKFDNPVRVIKALNNIIVIHLNINNLKLANQYIDRAFTINENIPNNPHLSVLYTLKGTYHYKIKEYKTALLNYQEAAKIERVNGHYYNLAKSLQDISTCHLELGNKEQAIILLKEAEEVLIAVGEKQSSLHGIQLAIAKYHLELKNYSEALHKGNESLELALKIGIPDSKLNSYKFLAQLYEELGNYEYALQAHKSASSQKDSLLSHQKDEVILELEAKYQTGKKELENELLRTQQKQNLTELKTKNTQIIAVIVIAALISLLAFLLFRAYQNKGRYSEKLQREVSNKTKDLVLSNEQLKQSNSELERFTFIASHDLKTPLDNIINFSNLLEKQTHASDNKRIKQCVHHIKEGGQRMKRLIEDVLEYSKLNAEERVNAHTQIDLNHLCIELEKSIVTFLQNKNAQIVISNRLPIIHGNYSSFFLLFKNFIENGVKYNESPQVKINIYSKSNRDTFSLFFEDNGIGIPEDFQDKVWEMFNRLHTYSEYEGTGLGLATCKKIVDSLGGTFHLESTVGIGSTFELKLPNTLLVSTAKAQFNMV